MKLLLLALSLAALAPCQEISKYFDSFSVNVLVRDAPSFHAVMLYRDDAATVDAGTTDLFVEQFTILITYTDQFGHRGMQSQTVSAHIDSEQPEMLAAGCTFYGLDNVTALKATVVDDSGRVTTAWGN